jgi:hypothetical protein
MTSYAVSSAIIKSKLFDAAYNFTFYTETKVKGTEKGVVDN